MNLPILPVVGSSGFYELLSPFDTAAISNIEYTCKAVRRLSDYVAANEDVKALVYTANSLPEDIWDYDVKNDAYIVSLQSNSGHWLYIPYRYILSYPSVNGIQYRAVMIGVSLPSIPAAQDLTSIKRDIKDLVETSLGMEVAVKQVETSRIIQVPYEKHIAKEQERNSRSMSQTTMTAKINKLRAENDALISKVSELEAYISKMKP